MTLKIVVAGLGLVLASCSRSQSSTPASPPPAKEIPTAPSQAASCESYATSEKLAAWNSAVTPESTVGAVRGGKPVPCEKVETVDGEQVKTPSQAFSEVVLVPRVRLGTETAIVRDIGRDWHADIALEIAAPAEADIGAIADVLGVRGTDVQLRVVNVELESAILRDLPDVRHQIVTSTDESGSKSVLRFYLPDSLANAFHDALEEFKNGAASVTVFYGPDFTQSTLFSSSARAGEILILSQDNTISAREYLASLWANIGASPASQDRELPFMWMENARRWWSGLKMQPADGQREWHAAWTVANELWREPGPATDAVGAESSLRALRFLLTVDPTNAAAARGATLSRLEGALGHDDGMLYSALMDVVKMRLDSAQETALFDSAKALAPISPRAREAWNSAVAVFSRAKGDVASAKTAIAAALWLSQVRGGGDQIPEASRWVFEKHVTSADIARLRALQEFMAKQGLTSDQAAARAIELVIDRGLAAPATDAYRALVEALRLTAAWTQAYERAAKYLFDDKIPSDRALAMAATIKWLARTRHADVAIAKAEDYHLVRKLSLEEILRIQSLWTWMQTTARNLEALDVAEDYVITKKLDADQTQAIVVGHDWLVYTPQAPQAWQKCEAYVMELKLSLEQVEQMSEVENWLRNSSVGAEKSVARAESYVIEKKLTRMQTNLIEISYLWLRGTSAKAVAVEKAEDYVLVKQLTAEKFKKLRDSYQKFKSAMDPKPLESAEKELFGAE